LNRHGTARRIALQLAILRHDAGGVALLPLISSQRSPTRHVRCIAGCVTMCVAVTIGGKGMMMMMMMMITQEFRQGANIGSVKRERKGSWEQNKRSLSA